MSNEAVTPVVSPPEDETPPLSLLHGGRLDVYQCKTARAFTDKCWDLYGIMPLVRAFLTYSEEAAPEDAQQPDAIEWAVTIAYHIETMNDTEPGWRTRFVNRWEGVRTRDNICARQMRGSSYEAITSFEAAIARSLMLDRQMRAFSNDGEDA